MTRQIRRSNIQSWDTTERWAGTARTRRSFILSVQVVLSRQQRTWPDGFWRRRRADRTAWTSSRSCGHRSLSLPIKDATPCSVTTRLACSCAETRTANPSSFASVQSEFAESSFPGRWHAAHGYFFSENPGLPREVFHHFIVASISLVSGGLPRPWDWNTSATGRGCLPSRIVANAHHAAHLTDAL